MSHNLYYQDVSTAGNFAAQDHCDQIRNAWTAMLTQAYSGTNVGSNLSANTIYTDVKLYDLDPATGRAASVVQSTFNASAAGNAGTTMPTEVALAVTLETGAPGRSNRGRIFLGGFGVGAVDPLTGRLKPTEHFAFAQAFGAFLAFSRDQTADVDAYRPVVYSRVKATARPITRVTIGNVFDVQRRRRNGLIEVRQGVDVNNAT